MKNLSPLDANEREPAIRLLATNEIESTSGGLTVGTVCRDPLVFNFFGIRFIFCRN